MLVILDSVFNQVLPRRVDDLDAIDVGLDAKEGKTADLIATAADEARSTRSRLVFAHSDDDKNTVRKKIVPQRLQLCQVRYTADPDSRLKHLGKPGAEA